MWLDYDRDGRLDLFFGGYYPESINLWKLADTKMMPESFEYAKNGGRKYLFHNLGGGRFEEVSEQAGSRRAAGRWQPSPATCAAPATPISSSRTTTACRNCSSTKAGHFREVGRDTGVGYAPKSGMNASVGDVLNQGRFAMYVSNISEEGILLQGNNLWVPTERHAGGLPQYDEHGDGDGHRARRVELRRAVRRSQQRRPVRSLRRQRLRLGRQERELLVRLSRKWRAATSSSSRMRRTGRRWGTRSLPGYQQKKVWINDGAGRFIDVAQMVGVTDRYDGRSIVLAELRSPACSTRWWRISVDR